VRGSPESVLRPEPVLNNGSGLPCTVLCSGTGRTGSGQTNADRIRIKNYLVNELGELKILLIC